MSEENTGVQDKDTLTQEERDKQSAEKYRAQLSPESTAQVVEDNQDDGKPQRPEHIPEKFWDAEKGEVKVDALAKSYAELEKSKSTPKADEKSTDDNLTDEQKAEKLEAEKAARETLGLPTADEIKAVRTRMTEKILAGEDFDDDDYAPFEKLGIDRETIDMVRLGLIYSGESHKAAVHKEAGGEEAYTSMIEWARENFTEEEISAYDRDIHSPDKAVSLNAVRGLAARYQVANGRTGRDVTKGQGSKTTAEGYKSKAEMVADMQDPKYAKDEAFRQSVALKIRLAKAAGVDLTR